MISHPNIHTNILRIDRDYDRFSHKSKNAHYVNILKISRFEIELYEFGRISFTQLLIEGK